MVEMGNFDCPACGSDRTQKVKLLYEAKKKSQPDVAENFFSPPVRPGLGAFWLVGLVGITGLVLSIVALIQTRDFFFGFLWLALSLLLIWLAPKGIKKNRAKRDTFQADYDKWGRTWYCPRCGNLFGQETEDQNLRR